LILVGNPFCQVDGEFQGRDERFSDSVVAQPLAPKPTAANTNASKIDFTEIFMI